MVDTLCARIARPIVFFPLLAILAVLSVSGVIQAGLALTERRDADLIRRVAYYQSHHQSVLVTRNEERLLHQMRVALRKRGYNAGPVDAAMDARTADVLRAFQQREGLPVTGQADGPTMMALGVEP
jgi:Putative peptidoglycan binding domain